ncbi:MAG TPA: hypothetical protein ENJ09_15800 [Planctomycetes bacterium]|nr:hypothetical protein [Planctomycetota bacterium]
MVGHAASLEGPSETDVPGRWERIAFWGLVFGMAISIPFWTHGWYDPTNDGAMYILTGRSLLAGDGYSMLGIPFRIRPPGFSAMLVPLLAWRGTDFLAIHLFVSAFGLAACVFLYRFARPRVGWPLAWLLTAYLWLNPGFRLLSNQTMSDVPGLAMALGCLVLARRLGERSGGRPTWRQDLLLGLLISATALVRSSNLLLVPAFGVVRLFDAWRLRGEDGGARRALLGALALGVGAFAVQLPWNLRNAAVAPPPPADQTLLYSYSTGFWHEDMGDPDSRRLSVAEVLARFPKRGGQAIGVLGNRLKERLGGVAGDEPWAALFLAGLLWTLVKRREAAEWFALGSLALISVYFGFAPRLLLPILVLALVATVEMVRDLAALVLGRTGGSAFAALGLAGLLALDANPRKGWDKIELQAERLGEITRRFEARLQPDAVLGSYRAWHYAVLMERPIFALEFVVKRHLDPETNQLDTRPLEELIDRYGINTVVLSPARRIDREILPYFEGKYGKQPDPLARVYRVR